jgi:hypothetical protein
METEIPLWQRLSLVIGSTSPETQTYATSRLQRGWLLRDGDQLLAEEAVGFGVPLLKQGMKTFFPGAASLEVVQRGPSWIVRAVYTVNLVERFSRHGGGSVNGAPFYLAKDSLAELIRRVPPLRLPLTSLSSALRRLFGWETIYASSPFHFKLAMQYGFDARTGALTLEADLADLQREPITEVIIMHEQGAHHFDEYRDSAGTSLSGPQVGCWDEVQAASARFSAPRRRLAFSVSRVPGTRLFRGRELIGSRLAWSGFGYSMPPTIGRFRGTLNIERLP